MFRDGRIRVWIERLVGTNNWFIIRDDGQGNTTYLHCDGEWRPTTKSLRGDHYPGLYENKEAAERILALSPERKNKMQKELQLSRNNWWQELDQKDLPQDIVMLLRGLIGSHMKSSIPPPEATPRLIALAKDYLLKGIWIGDNELFDVMVYTPEDTIRYRSFFVLIPKWPGGELKRLSEF